MTPNQGAQGDKIFDALIEGDNLDDAIDVYLGPGIVLNFGIQGPGRIQVNLEIAEDAPQTSRPVVVITTTGICRGPATFTVT